MSKPIKLLAIDASTDACSVALLFDGNILKEHELAPRAHTRVLLPMIQRLLEKAGIQLADLDALAFGRGPGSYTGVRIACSLVQALSFAMQKPIIPISTLRALAAGTYRKAHTKEILATLDAGLGEVYWGFFVVDGEGVVQSVSEERVGVLEENVEQNLWHKVTGAPDAEDIARLAAVEYLAGRIFLPEQVEPIYLREDFVKKTSH